MSTNLPSFDRAEYSLAPNPKTQSTDQCTRCRQPLEGSYYPAAWSLTFGTDPGAPDISGPFSNRSSPAPSL